MPTFPTLSVNPSVESWDEGVAFDPTISSPKEGGYRQTRARFARIPDKWHVGYYPCPAADKTLIRNFEKTVKVGSDSLIWTNPVDNTSHEVRFLAPVKYKMHGNQNYWDVEFDLEEV